MQIGDLIHHARIVRRDRAEREEADELARRREHQDDKAADEVRGLAAAFTGPTRNRTERLTRAEFGLQCATGKREVMEAIREWTAAKAEARKATA
jgi:hypothetical protein